MPYKKLIAAHAPNIRRAAVASLLMLTMTLTTSCSRDTSTDDTSDLRIQFPPTHLRTLPNGLRLIVREDRSSPVVSIQAWTASGSITEGRFTGAGISHFVEHMLFKGTSTRSTAEITQTIQSLGGYVNAYTSFDRTVYYVDAPADGWKTILDVIADAVFRSTLPADEVIKEQEVIRREFAMGYDDPNRNLHQLLFAAAFQHHPYRHPVIGHLEQFNQITRDDLIAYYREQYVPENLTFIVVGDVSADEVEAELTRLLADIPRRAMPMVQIPQEPRQIGRRDAEKEFPTDVRRMIMAWHVPGITDPDVYALDVLAIIAGGGQSSRLHRRLVDQDRLLRSISAFSYTPTQSGLWGASAVFLPGEEDLRPQVEAAISAIINDLRETTVTPAELAKAKRQVLVSRAAEGKTVSGQAASLGSSWLVARDLHFGDRYLERVQQVTAEDLIRVARRHLKPDSLTVVSLNPPAAASSAPTAAATKLRSVPTELVRITDNIPLVLTPDPKVPLVTLRASLAGGLLLENPETSGLGQLMTRLLDKGTKNYTAAQIAEEIESLGGELSVLYGNNSINIAIEVLSSDLPRAVELLAEILLDPVFPEDELDKERNRLLSDQQIENDNPLRQTLNHFRATFFAGHPYALNTLGSPQGVANVTTAQLRDLHQSLLAPDRIVLSVGGQFDPAQLTALLDNAFRGHLRASATPLPIPAPPQTAGTGQTVEIRAPRQQAIVITGWPGIAVDDPDRAAVELINECLSDMASRLFIRIREQQSLAYFVSASQLIGTQPGAFFVFAGTDPAKAHQARTEMLDEISGIVRSGFTADELDRARAKLLGEKLLQDQSAPNTAFKAALNVLYGLGPDHEEQLNQQIRTLTLDQLNASARRLFVPDRSLTVILLPES